MSCQPIKFNFSVLSSDKFAYTSPGQDSEDKVRCEYVHKSQDLKEGLP